MSNQTSIQWQAGDIILDLYKVTGILGEGGFGEVYKVRHLGWQIDIAVQNPTLDAIARLGGVEQLKQRVEAWATLEHPHITRCYYARLVEGHPLVFTEYVAGSSLQDWISDRRLYANGAAAAVRRILDIAIQWAWGLHHAAGQPSMCVSPETLTIGPEGIAKLTDLGLAKANPLYAAPEVEPNISQPHPQLSVWSWGLSVLEMFAGERIWASPTLADSSLQQYLAGAVKLEGSQSPQMPVQVVQVLQDCFHKNSAARPQFSELAQRLQAVYSEVIGRSYPRREPVPAAPADSLNNQAVRLWDLGQPSEALNLWEQAIALQPQHLESTYNRGLMLWRSGKVKDDKILLQQLNHSRAAESGWQVDYLLSLVHLERGDYQTALTLLEGIAAQGIQPEEITAAIALAQKRLPYTKQLLPNFGSESARHEITSITLGPTSRYALSGGEDGTVRLWDVPTGKCLGVFRGHQSRVSAVAFSPDGCYVLSGSDDQTLQLWNVADTSLVHVFDGRERRVASRYRIESRLGRLLKKLSRLTRSAKAHEAAVRSIVFSPDGRYMLSGSDDSLIKLWEVETGKCIRTLRGHRGRVLAVLFTPNGQHVLSASDDQTVRQWEAATGREVQSFNQHQALTSIAVSASGRYVAAGANPIKMWDLTTGQLTRTFEKQAQAIAFSPDGQFIVSAGEDHQINLWDIALDRCLRTLEGHSGKVQAIAISSDGTYALSADAERLKWWAIYSMLSPDLAPLRLSQTQLADPQTSREQRYEQELVEAQVALDQGDAIGAAHLIRQARSHLGYSRGAEAVQAWLNLYLALPRQSLNLGWEQATFERSKGAISAVALSPDGNFMLSGSVDITLKLWDIQTRRCLLNFEEHKGEVAAVAFSPVGRSALSGSADTTLKLWDISTGQCLRTWVGHVAPVRSAAFSPTGRFAVSGSEDRTCKLWEVATGRCLRTFEGHQAAVLTTALSSDGRSVVSGSADRLLKRWDVATGDCLNTLESHTAAVNAVALSADGRYAVSGSDDQTLKLWNLRTGECLRTFAGHGAAVRSVSLSADGRYAVSGSDDQTLKLWNLRTGECLWTFAGHGAAVRSVSLSADGRYVVSGSDDQTCKLCVLDWELADSVPTGWDEEVNPLLEAFLRLHTPIAGLPANRELSPQEVTAALTPQGVPTWTETNFGYLMQTLKSAGYGWIKPDQVRQQLDRLKAAIAPQPALSSAKQTLADLVKPPHATVFPTVFGTEFATVFGTVPAKVVLTVTAGSLRGQEFEFSNRTICLIGRAKDCHLQLPNDEQHRTISRYHCMLDINPPIARIRDLGSLHGTYINGRMIGRRQQHQTPEQAIHTKFAEHDLAMGDEIKLGQTVFLVRLEAEITPEADATAIGAQPAGAASATRLGSESAVPEIKGYKLLKPVNDNEVYLAQNSTGDRVALKVMVPRKALPAAAIESFLQEADTIKALQHPHIAQLRDSGYQDGAFFFVFDYCEGGSVLDLMQQRGGHLLIDEAVTIALQVLDGLEYAHSAVVRPSQQGLFHCSLKPSNILLTEAGKSQGAKIADYGLAKVFDQAGLGGLSMSGTAANLPMFMPRQQAVNFNYTSSEVDVWAVAACLYYMLTGAYPRNFSSGKDPYLVLLQSDPISIKERDATLPKPLSHLIDQALIDNPEIGFKTASVFKQALKAVL